MMLSLEVASKTMRLKLIVLLRCSIPLVLFFPIFLSFPKRGTLKATIVELSTFINVTL